MDVRKSATALTENERDRFREAIIRLKAKQAVGAPDGTSVYDQFVALHGAVMGVLTPGVAEAVNFGHWDIGFLPWHRQYLRSFEFELQQEVSGVALPYWDWTEHVESLNKLFTDDFLSSLNVGPPAPVRDGLLRNVVPASQRPSWWPNGIAGFRVHQHLEDGRGRELTRGSQGVAWPPTASAIATLEDLVIQTPQIHPLWIFWLVLEQGDSRLTTRTHNAGQPFHRRPYGSRILT